MRQALWENNLQLWHTLEERRTLQSSITHDLRNPLAIVSGSVEYLQENLSDLPEAEIAHTLSNIEVTAERMERYTASLKKLNSLEDTRMQPSETALPDFFTGLTESLQVLARPRVLEVAQSIPRCTVRLDPEMVCRVLENLTANAARYAEHTIRLSFSLEENLLTARLTDDGPGFPARVLKHRDGLFPSGDSSDVHMGLGLAASRIFCQKHGGALKLSNLPSGGACAEASFAIERVSDLPDP